jgi:hypothetical protein
MLPAGCLPASARGARGEAKVAAQFGALPLNSLEITTQVRDILSFIRDQRATEDGRGASLGASAVSFVAFVCLFTPSLTT